MFEHIPGRHNGLNSKQAIPIAPTAPAKLARALCSALARPRLRSLHESEESGAQEP